MKLVKPIKGRASKIKCGKCGSCYVMEFGLADTYDEMLLLDSAQCPKCKNYIGLKTLGVRVDIISFTKETK